MKKLLRDQKGTTLVEVILAFTIMLIMISALWGSFVFSRSAQEKSLQIRARAAEVARLLREEMEENPTVPQGTPAEYRFIVVGGKTPQFTIHAQKVERTLTLADGSSITIYQFQTPDGGGGTP